MPDRTGRRPGAGGDRGRVTVLLVAAGRPIRRLAVLPRPRPLLQFVRPDMTDSTGRSPRRAAARRRSVVRRVRVGGDGLRQAEYLPVRPARRRAVGTIPELYSGGRPDGSRSVYGYRPRGRWHTR